MSWVVIPLFVIGMAGGSLVGYLLARGWISFRSEGSKTPPPAEGPRKWRSVFQDKDGLIVCVLFTPWGSHDVAWEYAEMSILAIQAQGMNPGALLLTDEETINLILNLHNHPII